MSAAREIVFFELRNKLSLLFSVSARNEPNPGKISREIGFQSFQSSHILERTDTPIQYFSSHPDGPPRNHLTKSDKPQKITLL